MDTNETLAEIARKIAWGGITNDPILGDAQTVAVPRAWYDRLVAALDTAPANDPLAIAAHALIATADASETDADFPVPAFDVFAEAENIARTGTTREAEIDAALRAYYADRRTP